LSTFEKLATVTGGLPAGGPAGGSGAGGSAGGSGAGAGAGPQPILPSALALRGFAKVRAKVRLRTLLRGLAVRVSCPSTCTVRIRLTVPRRPRRGWSGLVARLTRVLPAGTRKLVLKPGRRMKRRLRNIRRLQVFLTARATQSGGPPAFDIARRISVTR
jgi:hypothetical protein